MDAFPLQGVQVGWEHCNKGFPLSCPHLCQLAIVQDLQDMMSPDFTLRCNRAGSLQTYTLQRRQRQRRNLEDTCNIPGKLFKVFMILGGMKPHHAPDKLHIERSEAKDPL